MNPVIDEKTGCGAQIICRGLCHAVEKPDQPSILAQAGDGGRPKKPAEFVDLQPRQVRNRVLVRSLMVIHETLQGRGKCSRFLGVTTGLVPQRGVYMGRTF